jgi:hypothetical protein
MFDLVCLDLGSLFMNNDWWNPVKVLAIKISWWLSSQINDSLWLHLEKGLKIISNCHCLSIQHMCSSLTKAEYPTYCIWGEPAFLLSPQTKHLFFCWKLWNAVFSYKYILSHKTHLYGGNLIKCMSWRFGDRCHMKTRICKIKRRMQGDNQWVYSTIRHLSLQ